MQGVSLWTDVCPPQPPHKLPATKMEQTFHQPGFFNGFWAVSGQTLFLVTYVGWGYWTLYFLSWMAALDDRTPHLGLEIIFYNKKWIEGEEEFTWGETFLNAGNKLLEKIIQEGRALGPGNQWDKHGCAHILSTDFYCADHCRVCTSSSQGPGCLCFRILTPGPQAQTSPKARWGLCKCQEEQQTDFFKANCFLHFLNERKCVCVGNLNKFVRIWWLDKRSIKLVSRHKELFRKWLTFKATPKKDKDFVYSMRPLE